jgi:hypothetical protein
MSNQGYKRKQPDSARDNTPKQKRNNTDWRDKDSQNKRGRLRVALANIEKMDTASLTELQVAIENMNNKSNYKPDIIGLTETWENTHEKVDYLLKGYSYIGKPRERRANTNRDTGGTCLWVIDDMANQCSKVTPKVNHPDILWIQIVTRTQTTYVAVVYSRPKDLVNHKLILTTLEKNNEQYSTSGKVVIIGDLNSRIAEVGKNGPYERELVSMLKNTGMAPLVASKAVISRDEQWTFVGRMGGRSINDYILINHQDRHGCTYAVHPGVNLQGQHRLLTCTLPYTKGKDGFEWGTAERSTFDWSDEGIRAYKILLEKSYPSSALAAFKKTAPESQTKEDA